MDKQNASPREKKDKQAQNYILFLYKCNFTLLILIHYFWYFATALKPKMLFNCKGQSNQYFMKVLEPGSWLTYFANKNFKHRH